MLWHVQADYIDFFVLNIVNLVAHFSSKIALINLSAVRNRSQPWKLFKYCNAFSLKQIDSREHISFLDTIILLWWMTLGSIFFTLWHCSGTTAVLQMQTETPSSSLSAPAPVCSTDKGWSIGTGTCSRTRTDLHWGKQMQSSGVMICLIRMTMISWIITDVDACCYKTIHWTSVLCM